MILKVKRASENCLFSGNGPRFHKPLFRFLSNWYGYIIAN
jgi:hypothetical protein